MTQTIHPRHPMPSPNLRQQPEGAILATQDPHCSQFPAYGRMIFRLSEHDLNLRVLVALLRKVEGGGSLVGWHTGSEQRFYVDQPTIKAGDGMGEFSVEAHGAAEVDLLGHDKITSNRELTGRKGTHLDDGCTWSHGLEAGREAGRITGYL